MFHQANFWRYDGAHSLFTDLVDRTFQKYAALSNLPVFSLPQSVIGKRLENNLARVHSPVRAVINPGNWITLSSDVELEVPVTGICPFESDTYGDQKIARLKIEAGGETSVPIYQ
jgi:hypothetical protein